MSTKKYGLILPDKNKKQPVFQASRNVFGSDNDSDDEKPKRSLIPTSLKRQAKVIQEKAVIEDPTVYQYDEIYDDIKEKINEEKQKTKGDRNPKYIENLLKTAQKRKLENERRIERQVHKEREKEGTEFSDKEIFVTTAYKNKLEEMQKEEEREKYEEYLETIGDVRKQNDLGGFYRHLYEQKLGSIKPQGSETKSKDNEENVKNATDIDSSIQKTKISRNYRKRKTSADINLELSDGEIVSDEDEINRLNLNDIKASKKICKDENIDADSDFSVNDPSDSDDIQNDSKVKDQKENEFKVIEDIIKVEDNNETADAKLSPKKEEAESKPKIDIWKKRTTGIVFEEALKRYYERKSVKSM